MNIYPAIKKQEAIERCEKEMRNEFNDDPNEATANKLDTMNKHTFNLNVHIYPKKMVKNRYTVCYIFIFL